MNSLQIPYIRIGLSIIFGLLLTLITTIQAQRPGDLDPTFNNSGIVTTTIGGDWQWGIGVAIQSDDKIGKKIVGNFI